MSARDQEELAIGANSSMLRQLRGMLRRMVVTLTDTAIWQVLGQHGGQGGDETDDVESFTGIGFYSRPGTTGNPEAIMASIGGAKTRVIIAARDEAIRKLIANIEPDETATFNSLSITVHKADGTVEVRSASGTAVPLATKADLDALTKYVSDQFNNVGGHIHATPGGPTTTIVAGPTAPVFPLVVLPPTPPPPTSVGTTVLKGE